MSGHVDILKSLIKEIVVNIYFAAATDVFMILTISTTVSSLYTSMGELYWMFSKKGFPTAAQNNKYGT